LQNKAHVGSLHAGGGTCCPTVQYDFCLTGQPEYCNIQIDPKR
jgi:hypothetical protein